MKRIIALSLCILTLFLCACQPTPEVEPVPNKGDDVMGEKIHTTPVPKTPSPTSEADPDLTGDPDVTEVPFVIPHIDVPDHWTEEMTLPGRTKVYIDADIEYEDTAHPVYLVKDAEHFDGAVLKRLIDFFSLDMKWRPADSTRAELLDRLKELLAEQYYIDQETGEKIVFPMDSDREEAIAGIIKRLQELDPEINWQDIKTTEDIPQGFAVLTDGKREYHTSQLGAYFSMTSFGDNLFPQSEMMILQAHKKLPTPPMEKEDALRFANTVLEEVGLSTHLQLASVTIGCCLDSRGEVQLPYWEIVFALKVDGAGVLDVYNCDINGQFIKGAVPIEDEYEYHPPMKLERMSLCIGDGEIVSVNWMNPQEVVSIENPAVELLPFDVIQQRIKKRIEYGRAWSDGKFYDIHINKISLVYLKSAKANSIYEYYYSPMWCFYSNADNEMPLLEGVHFINAIDGTFVIPDKTAGLY